MPDDNSGVRLVWPVVGRAERKEEGRKNLPLLSAVVTKSSPANLAGSVANAEMAHAFVNLAQTTGKWCVDAVKQERERESFVPGGWRPAC